MSFLKKHKLLNLLILLAVSALIRFYLLGFFQTSSGIFLKMLDVLVIIIFGAYILKKIAEVIEETTEILSEKTKLASGLLQSLGTAFPDMVLGLIAALISWQLKSTDYARAINFAIIAAATTFGSNIYNIGFSLWCIFRQNQANLKNRTLQFFPKLKWFGAMKPMSQHENKPTLKEFDVSINVLNALTLLTAIVAISMVIFGHVANPPGNISGDLYQLIQPVGLVILILSIFILYSFRHSHRAPNPEGPVQQSENYYRRQPLYIIWLSLILSGVAILLTAESMVRAIEIFCELTSLSFVVAGLLAGIIGCLGEMLVIYDFSIHPEGRIGDAVVGVAMDNIVTILGAALVALLGGIFLGGNALILIFVIILTLNSLLVAQIAKLKNFFLK